jgi:hypothetical protein
VTSDVVAHVAATPTLAGRGQSIATAVQSGQIGSLLEQLPPPLRGQVALITKDAFTSALNRIILVAAIIAIAAGVIAFLTIRNKDFAHQRTAAPA